MKTLRNKIQLAVIALILGLGTMNCQKSESVDLKPIDKVKVEENAALYANLMNARASYKGSPFEILEIKRNENLVTIVVEGGCDTQAYKVIWDGVVNFTEPMSANLLVVHDPAEVQCLAIKRHQIEVDLKIILGKAYLPNLNLQISNSSKINDNIVDVTGVVTTKKK